MMRMIILPQALKLVIPGIVNSFIALFKDTTLVLIIGLFDFLGMIQSSYSDSKWASPVQSLTGYLFAAMVFWVFCFAMSRYSIFMERRLDTGHKRFKESANEPWQSQLAKNRLPPARPQRTEISPAQGRCRHGAEHCRRQDCRRSCGQGFRQRRRQHAGQSRPRPPQGIR